jgi:uncharacterized protein (DUF885 family)
VTLVYDLAHQYVEEWARLDPIDATGRGVVGYDTEMTDYSPDGIQARSQLVNAYLGKLAATPIESDADRIAATVLKDRLEVDRDQHAAGERLRDLRIIGSPVQSIRQVFDLMPRSTVEEWEVVAARMEKIPAAIDGFVITLREGQAKHTTAASRQAIECAKQAETWSGDRPFFVDYIQGAPEGVQERLGGAAAAATSAYARLGRYLRDEYAPAATETDAVGQERYALAARSFLGLTIDPLETYRWGWEDLRRIETEMAAEADKILPGGSVEAAKQLLESDPTRAIEGEDRLRDWLQELMDTTIAELDGKHFDIPAPIKRVEAMIAPPGGAAAMYYTGPSEDLSRPGRTWYPTLGKTRFPLWGEVSIAYHEGVPGHHLQIGQVRSLATKLSRFQRVTALSGYAEGWALYAERLMDELGYLSVPDYRLGQLRAQAMRAVRVIVDIGMHLQLSIPKDQSFHPGETWTPELAEEFAIARAHFPSDFMKSEIVRYLGWPGQAISYKVGERVWLETREDVKRKQGLAFDLKTFHKSALDLGPWGSASCARSSLLSGCRGGRRTARCGKVGRRRAVRQQQVEAVRDVQQAWSGARGVRVAVLPDDLVGLRVDDHDPVPVVVVDADQPARQHFSEARVVEHALSRRDVVAVGDLALAGELENLSGGRVVGDEVQVGA